MRRHGRVQRRGVAMVALVLCATLAGFGAGGGEAYATESKSSARKDSTSGAAFNPPKEVMSPSFNAGSAVSANDSAIDVSAVSEGVVLTAGKSSARLKLLVTCGEMSYNYDIPGDGTPIACPVNMGNGTYTFAVMRNTEGNNYAELVSTTTDVKLESEFAPFLHPSVICDYENGSDCVKKARELTKGAKTQGDALAAICNWVTDNVTYDKKKAAQVGGKTGYLPDPDDTLNTRKGICFDYAALSAALLRSVGLPARVVTGYVSPGDLYHAWTVVYIDGTWKSVYFTVDSKTWTRVDLTFAAGSPGDKFVGDGKKYTDRYVY